MNLPMPDYDKIKTDISTAAANATECIDELQRAASAALVLTEPVSSPQPEAAADKCRLLESGMAELRELNRYILLIRNSAEQVILDAVHNFNDPCGTAQLLNDTFSASEALGRILEDIRKKLDILTDISGDCRDTYTAIMQKLGKHIDELQNSCRQLHQETCDLLTYISPTLDMNAAAASGSFVPGDMNTYYESTPFPEADMDFGGGFIPEPDAMVMPDMIPPMPGAAPPMPAPPAAAKSASASRKVKAVRVDSVAFSALSPEKVKKGEYGCIDLYMYTKSQRRIVEKAIKSASQKLTETEKSGFRVGRGCEVKVILRSDDVEITEPVDSKIWEGECSRFDFQFFVPENYAKKQIAFTCYVLLNDIQITRLHFSVGINSAGRSVPVKIKRNDNRKAFVSYSHKDEKRVLAKLAAITEVAPRMVFWLDSQSLESGDVWRKEIRRAIRNADVFLLFWSAFARQSEEVKKEWTYALKKKGLRFIAPVPLDPPAKCPPPEELGALHFGDSSFSYSEEMDSLSFATSRQFRKIK